MTIKELSNKTGLSTIHIGYMEANRTKGSLSTLRKLAEVLDTTVAYLGCFENLPGDTFGQKIYKARHYHGLTMKEFANKLGVNPWTIRKWENGSSKPLEENFNKLTKMLDILNK